MNTIRFKLIIFSVVLILFSSLAPSSSDDRNAALVDGILTILQRGHYAPPEINDEFSAKVFDLYIKRLDYGKRYLLESDVEQLSKYRQQIDDELRDKNFNFFDASYQLINKRMKEAENFYDQYLDKPFDYTQDESIELDPEKMDFAVKSDDLKRRWELRLKYETLSRLSDALEIQEKAEKNKDTSVKIKSFDSLESEARSKVKKAYTDFFHRVSQETKEGLMEHYINAICNVYDPHTGYFAPKEKEDFDIKMSGSLEGIGALLRQSEEYIKVEEIIAGSPSWRQGQLKKDDIILKVAQGYEEPVDVVDMKLDEAVRLIRGKKGTEVRLTIKKPDGRIMMIPIIRDVVVIEESFAKSLILEDNNNDGKYGYIKLPSFYADFSKRGGRSCAEDVKTEIKHLSDENVDGIILDLRDNGGGSLDEVVEMAGLFIDNGPIVQVHYNNGATKVLEDRDGITYYSGPLIIMVNTFSASASEILSAAMQDYKRAVIIGSTTYGKGTVQRFDDLDNYAPMRFDHLKPLGAVKYTIQKFYRINGKTTQLHGVTPDIVFPDQYAHISIGEKEMDYALAGDEIKPSKYQPFDNYMRQLDQGLKRSQQMIRNDSTMRLVEENAQRIKKFRDKTVASLNLKKFRTEQAEFESESKKFENIGKSTQDMKALNLKVDATHIQSDSSYIVKNEAWIENVKKDVYLYQTLKVIENMKGKLSKN